MVPDFDNITNYLHFVENPIWFGSVVTQKYEFLYGMSLVPSIQVLTDVILTDVIFDRRHFDRRHTHTTQWTLIPHSFWMVYV